MERAADPAPTPALDGPEPNQEEWAADPFAALAQLVDPDAVVTQFVSHAQTELVGLPGFTPYFLAYAAAVLRRPRQPLMLRALLGAVCSQAVDQRRLACAEGYHRLSGTLAADVLDTERRRVECWLDRRDRLGADAIRDEVDAWDSLGTRARVSPRPADSARS